MPFRPGDRVRRLAAPAGLLGAVAVACGYVGVVDPNDPGHYPVCPLRQATGLWCPGCGGLRCVHALVHGDLPAALHANLLAVAAFAACAVLWVRWTVRAVAGWSCGRRPGRVSRQVPWVLVVLVAVFTVTRNLPVGHWLRP